MDLLKKMLGNGPVFFVAYLIGMLPTYFLPYLGSNSSVVTGMLATVDAGVSPATWIHSGAMLFLCALCWIRGAHVDKPWLIVFPLLALAFDFVPGLSSIPMVPTVMHLLAIILGFVGVKPASVGSPTAG